MFSYALVFIFDDLMKSSLKILLFNYLTHHHLFIKFVIKSFWWFFLSSAIGVDDTLMKF